MPGLLESLLKSKYSSPLGTLMRVPLRLIPRDHVATVRGGINKGARWVVGSSVHGCWLGTYDNDKQPILEKFIREGTVVWDVGANAGYYMLAFSRLVGSRGRVYAFEPFAENTVKLIRHARINNLSNTKIIQAALADKTGLIGFSIAESHTMGGISAVNDAYIVSTLSVDDFISRYPESRPQFLKIDVEGAEGALLRGAQQLLTNFAPDIYLALHGAGQRRECCALLRSHGYALTFVDGAPVPVGDFEADEVLARKIS